MALSIALVAPFVVAKADDRQDGIHLQHVPDTWETTATDDSIYFDIGSSAVDAAATAVIQRHAAKLEASPELRVILVAHTNALGSPSLELAKGQERLDVVRKRLEDLKISPQRIRTENHGAEIRAPLPCTDDECRRTSRRVDVLFNR